MNIGLIGCGHMGEALLSGFLDAQFVSADQLFVTTLSETSRQRLKTHYSIQTPSDNVKLATYADVIILATKPDVYEKIIDEIRPYLTKNHLIISITPAFTLNQLRRLCGKDPQIARAMPNTPSKINQGVTGVSFESTISDASKELVKRIFSLVGVVIEVKEEQLALVGTLSGSMPAFFLYYLKSMLDYGLEQGLDIETTKQLVTKTIEGTLNLYGQSQLEINALIDQVCSKGGSTIEAIRYYNEHHLEETLKQGLAKTTKRFKAMEQEHE